MAVCREAGCFRAATTKSGFDRRYCDWHQSEDDSDEIPAPEFISGYEDEEDDDDDG